MQKKKIIPIIIGIILIGSLLGIYFLASAIYDDNFNYRCTTSEKDSFELSEFETLTRESYTFPTKQGHQLAAYLYEQNDPLIQEKAVIVFAHGMGAGGQMGYMDIFDYLTKAGYYVFAYDATANDESEGEVLGGFPQGYIDLNYAIDYAYGIEKIRSLPFMLMGYSWGGFSVSNVLKYHPEVEAVVSMAGWNESLNLIEYYGCQVGGDVVKAMLPFVKLHEYLKYGEYAFSTAMDGFKKSDCRVMIVHGAKDDTVPIEYGYDIYYEQYGNDERFVFKRFDGRKHSVMNNWDGTRDFELFGEIVDFLDQSLQEH